MLSLGSRLLENVEHRHSYPCGEGRDSSVDSWVIASNLADRRAVADGADDGVAAVLLPERERTAAVTLRYTNTIVMMMLLLLIMIEKVSPISDMEKQQDRLVISAGRSLNPCVNINITLHVCWIVIFTSIVCITAHIIYCLFIS